MSDSDDGGRVAWPWFFVPLFLVCMGALAAVSCFAGGSFGVTQGPKRGPPTQSWEYSGADAIRVGWGSVAVSLAGLLLGVNAFLAGRTSRALRPRVAAALVCFSVAALLYFPPWQMTYRGVIAAFWAFLMPALAGLILGRGCGTFILGILAGIVLSAFVGRQSWLNGMMPGIMALMAVGGHLGALSKDWVRREISRGGLTR